MNDVEQVKERLDIAEVISAYVPLKQAGRNLKAPCPFHSEKSASFMVSPEKGIWHCFGCGEGGDVITFVMKYEGLEFRPALELLARKAGVELKERGPVDAKAKQERQRLSAALDWAVKYYQASLVKNRSALDYAVKVRGLTRQTIKDFGIGYAPDDWNALGDFLLKKKFNASELKRAGLVGQKAGRSSLYDLYRGRLMFTICDAQGSPVGFTGRALDAEQLPKYLNTPQTELYDKSRVIYGLHLAREAIRAVDEVVLVEGNMDVVASHQAGVKQVVAASGTALTVTQLKALGRLTKNIKICFDADAAGIRATERAIELSQNLGLTLQMVRLPDAKDPDELIKKSVASWKQAIAGAQYVVDYLFDQLEQQYDIRTVTGKRQYSDRLAANLRRLGDPVEQDHYVQQLATKLGIDPKAVRQKLEQAEATALSASASRGLSERSGASSASPDVRRAATVTQPEAKPVKQLLEESVLAMNLAYPGVRLSLEDLTPAHFTNPDHQLILEALQQVGPAPAAEVAVRLPNISDYVKILVLRGEEQYSSFAPADRSFEAFQLVGRLQTATNKDTKTKLSRKLREAEAKGDADLAKRLLKQFQALITEEE
ncbi:MAG TPA: DNA primase [Candidatus Saccharimonadales bacterium]|nr:DNA primase [Candidatus Saccharimonadales bacterium]